jgi:hypothetical protein
MTPTAGLATATLAGVSRLQLAPVAQGLSDFEAKVVTARLGADGILWEVRGVVDSLYPLGGIDVLVPVDELESARVSLRGDGPGTAGAAEPAGGGHEPPEDVSGLDDGGHGSTGARRWWVTAAVVIGLAAFSATRMVGAITSLQQPGPDDCSGSVQAATEGLTVRCRR